MVDQLGEEERLRRVLADLRGVLDVDRLCRRIVGPGAASSRAVGPSQTTAQLAERHQSGPLIPWAEAACAISGKRAVFLISAPNSPNEFTDVSRQGERKAFRIVAMGR